MTSAIGPLHYPVTSYRISYGGKQVTVQPDFPLFYHFT